MASTISFGGLASGLDTNNLISSLMRIEQIPITKLESRQQTVDQAKSLISTFSSKLTTLQSAARALSEPTGFNAYTATSSSSNIVSTVTGNATAGRFDITVQKLAKEQRTYSKTMTSDTNAIVGMVDGTLRLTVEGSSAVDIEVKATDSLATLATRINQSGARAAASVVYTGSEYKLQVRGMDLAKSVDYSSGSTADVLTAMGFTDYQAAQKSRIVVDGNTIERSSNQITDVISGVSLALTKEDSSNPVTVSVAGDIGAIRTKVQSFVNAYNDVVQTGHVIAGFGTIKPQSAMTGGDSSIRSSLMQLSGVLTRVVSNTTGRYNMLASVGLASTRDGKMSFDESKFASALSTDPTSVAKLFITDSNLGATGLMKTVGDLITTMTSSGGTVASRVDMFASQSTQIGKDIDKMSGHLEQTEERLKKQFAAMEVAVSKYKGMSGSLTSLDNMSSYYR